MPKDTIFQLESFRQATPYIYAHRGKTFVLYIKDALLAKESTASLIHDLALVHTLGVKLVLVLGLRTFIDKKLGKQPASAFKNDWRITDAKTLNAIKEIAGSVKTNIEALFSIGLINTPMSGMKLNVVSGNYVRAKPVGVRSGVDYQHTGEVRSIAADEIQSGMGRTGKMFAIEHWGVEPDLLIVGKSLAAGMPLSGIVGKKEMYVPVPSS